MSIHLVRHATPEVVAGTVPALWELSASGRTKSVELSSRLPEGGVWASSTETVAVETVRLAAPAGTTALHHAGFDEVRRTERHDGDFHDRRRAWIENRFDERHAGWETPKAAAARFDQAVNEVRESGQSLVVVSHGMVMTAWLVHAHKTLTVGDAVAFWHSLKFPDVVVVD